MLLLNKLILFGAAASTLLFGGFKLQDQETAVRVGQSVLTASLLAGAAQNSMPVKENSLPLQSDLSFFTPGITFRAENGHTIQLELKGVTDTRLLQSVRSRNSSNSPTQPVRENTIPDQSVSLLYHSRPVKESPAIKNNAAAGTLGKIISSVFKSGYSPEIIPHSPYIPEGCCEEDLTSVTSSGYPPVRTIPLSGINTTGLPPFSSLLALRCHPGCLARGGIDHHRA